MSYTKEIKIHNKTIKVQILSDADLSVFEEVFVDKDYGLLDDTIKKSNNFIIDIGAHKGFFSIYANTLNAKTPIFSYEPENNNFQEFKINLKNNNAENVFPKNIAVAKDTDTKILYISEDSHNHSINDKNQKTSEQKVSATTLDKILTSAFKKTQKNYCDLLKLDAEGAEYEILNSTSTESFKKIKKIYIEYHEFEGGKKKEELKRILEAAGYKIQIKSSHYDQRFGFILAQH